MPVRCRFRVALKTFWTRDNYKTKIEYQVRLLHKLLRITLKCCSYLKPARVFAMIRSSIKWFFQSSWLDCICDDIVTIWFESWDWPWCCSAWSSCLPSTRRVWRAGGSRRRSSSVCSSARWTEAAPPHWSSLSRGQLKQQRSVIRLASCHLVIFPGRGCWSSPNIINQWVLHLYGRFGKWNSNFYSLVVKTNSGRFITFSEKNEK